MLRPSLGCFLAIAAACALVFALLAFTMSGDGARTTFLLVGIDRREGTGWSYRTDTIMLITLDPQTQSAGLLSIPRDLQLTIPGWGDDRINTANVYGYQNDYPGGGPALLQATVLSNFGIHTDGCVLVDFQTFVRIVDSLGGIDVDVTETLLDTRYPDPRPGDPYAFKTVIFEPGLQHMDGARALEYARSRMSTSDFDRARRQQQVVVALREKALGLKAVPRWPALAAAVLDGTHNTLDLIQLLRITFASWRIDAANLRLAVLEPPLVYSYQRPDGAAVQLPNWDLINPLLDEILAR